jgi:ABC-type sugar transport system permease subunit
MNRFFSNKLAIVIFALPALLLFTIFVVYPILPQIIVSTTKHNGIRRLGFVGLDNYKSILVAKETWQALANNGKLVAYNLFIGLPISLALALVIDRMTLSVRRFFKTASFMPAVLSVTVIAQMWIAIYQPRWGVLNACLRLVGLGSLATPWLSNLSTVVPAVGFAFLWQYIGLNMVIYYTGIKSIPKSYYEAALIDGASHFQTNIKIVIPLLQDVTKFMLIISVMGCMRQFEHVKIMTGGGPGSASRTIVFELFYVAFTTSEFGKGCALAVLFIILCLGINILFNRIVARERIEF